MSVSVSMRFDVYQHECLRVLAMCRRASKSVSKNMYDVTTRPGLVQRDFTVSKCVAKSVSLFLSVCLCVCKSVGLFLTCVLECVKECLYVYEC